MGGEIFSTRQQKPKTRLAKTEQEAKRKIKELKQLYSHRNADEVKKMTVQMYMDTWFNNVKSVKLKPKSLDALESSLEHQVYPHIGDMQIGALNASDVQSMVKKLTEKGLAYSTIKKAYMAVNACFKLGVIRKEVVENPCLGIELSEPLERSKSDIRFFTQEEADLISKECLLKYPNGRPIYRLGHAVIILLKSGMRIGYLA